MTEEKIDLFIKEGILSKYSEALETLYLFEKELKKRLAESVQQPNLFSEFQIALDPRDIQFKTEGSRREGYIWTVVTGKINKKKVKMDAGIWWNAKEFSERVVCYANFKHITFKPVGLPEGIKFKTTESNTRLYIVPDPSFDPVIDFARLIRELQRQAAKSPELR